MTIVYIIIGILVVLAGIYVVRRYVFEGYKDAKEEVEEVEEEETTDQPADKPEPEPVPEKMERSKQEVPQPPSQKALVDMPPIEKKKGPAEPSPDTAPLPKESKLAEKAEAVAKEDPKKAVYKEEVPAKKPVAKKAAAKKPAAKRAAAKRPAAKVKAADKKPASK